MTSASVKQKASWANASTKTSPSAGLDGIAISQPNSLATNRTGLPDALKSGGESLSGLALDDVRVHSNSSKPAGLQALAYTQGTDIHVGPGQERHVPHEAWHVVQQKKSEQARSIAQSESAMATKAVGLLKGKLQPLLKAHIFEAKPADGKAVDVASPVGLHAYTGGGLPGTLASVRTEGSENRVHGLEWKWKKNAATKRSSMFPTWMSADRVCTYIALEYSDNTDVVTEDLTNLLSNNVISKVKVQSRISRGMNPELEKKGDTVYPVNEGIRDWIEE